MAGYSGTPLVKKLGISGGEVALVLHSPNKYSQYVPDLPADFRPDTTLRDKKYEFMHYFATTYSGVYSDLPRLRDHLNTSGMLWISWPKKTSLLKTDLTENIIRDLGLQTGLVDVKVCAIDDNWSALKFVVRLRDR